MTQELAPGSEFVGESKRVVRFDCDGERSSVGCLSGQVNIKNGSYRERCFADARDVLAVINSDGCDPVRVAARKLIEQINLWSEPIGDNLTAMVEIGALEPELSALEALL